MSFSKEISSCLPVPLSSHSQKIKGIALIHREQLQWSQTQSLLGLPFSCPPHFPYFFPFPIPSGSCSLHAAALPIPRGSLGACARNGWRDVAWDITHGRRDIAWDITHGRCGRGSLRRRISKSSFQQYNNSGISPSLTPSLPQIPTSS